MIRKTLYVLCLMSAYNRLGLGTEQCVIVPVLHMDAANKIWNFLKVNDKLIKSDVIIGLGSHDPRVAMETAMLWLEGWADVVVFSGHSGNLTDGRWNQSEAEVFRDIAVSMGVPSCKIYTEIRSRNTGENIRFSYELLKTRYRIPQRIILVQKPHMGKRTVATFWKQWPQQSNTLTLSLVVRTLKIALERYPTDDVGDLSDVISVMMGYLQRLPLYCELGFQTCVHIPVDVWESFKFLQQTNMYNSYFI
ncbi:uncharacterized protein SCO4629-like [Ostrea edulis]|uniref:uncharacterized protein SCO4629-like n=1 Tax=Ostrea edulis TaxID=37623 RepID=UPI0024AEB44E|nr:uncharacterized protein SCO4629-like [Ostrea edulis]